MSRYKDHYPTFMDYLFKRNRGFQSRLTEIRLHDGIWPFLKAFRRALKYDIKLKGFRKALHDHFIGTRIL